MKKISFVAILLSFTVLFAACNIGLGNFENKQNKETGKLSLSINKTDVEKMLSKVNARAVFADEEGGNTEPEEPEEELTDLEKEALPVLEVIVKGDSDFYEVKSIKLDEVFFDSEESEESETPEFTESFVFEGLPENQTYTVFALLNVEGMTFVYGKTEGVTIVPDETVPVNVKVSSLFAEEEEEISEETKTYYSVPKVTVSGVANNDEKHEYYFSINTESSFGKDKKEVYGFDSYPVTFTVTFAAEKTNNLVKVFDAQEKFVKSNEAENECKIDITLNEDDEEFTLLDFVRNVDSQAMNCCYVKIENNVSKNAAVNEVYEDTKYALFNFYDPKGIWLKDTVPGPEEELNSNEVLTGTNTGTFSSFQFDDKDGLWYISQGNKLYRNGVDVGFAAAFPGYTPQIVSFDIVKGKLYIWVSETSTRNVYIFELEIDDKESADFKLSSENQTNKLGPYTVGTNGQPLTADLVSAFTIYDEKLLFALRGYTNVYCFGSIADSEATRVDVSARISDKVKNETFEITDLIIEGGDVYVSVKSVLGSAGNTYTQRGCIVSYKIVTDEFGDCELEYNTSFNNGKPFGWTNNTQLSLKVGILQYNLISPASQDAKTLFGGVHFIGRKRGKLIFSDAGVYISKECEISDVRRVFVLDLDTDEAETYDTCADLGLQKGDYSVWNTILKYFTSN